MIDDPYCDPGIEFDGTGIGVLVFWSTNVDNKDLPKYGAYTSTYDPGVMYHRDGSGTPPSTELHDLGPESEYPLIEAFKALIANYIHDFLDAETERRIAEILLWIG